MKKEKILYLLLCILPVCKIIDVFLALIYSIGKVSFEKNKLVENVKKFIEAITKNKPDGIKGRFIKKVSIASTMGLGIKLNVADLQ